jgi:integrase
MQAANRRPGTVKLHRHYLNQLADAHRSPWTVTLEQLERFLANPAWGPEARKSARTVVRGFYRWAYGNGFIDHDPSFELPGVHVPPGRPRPTPEPVVRVLVTGADRTAFLATLAADMGMRVGEICQVLPKRDLVRDYGWDADGNEIEIWRLTVHGKGGKIRVLPVVNPKLLAWLQRAGDDWAFPNRRGGHLTAGHVSKLLSKAMPENWTGHTLRHRAGTVAHRRTGDLLGVKDFLGHAMLSTTQRYVLPDDGALLAIAAATSTVA